MRGVLGPSLIEMKEAASPGHASGWEVDRTYVLCGEWEWVGVVVRELEERVGVLQLRMDYCSLRLFCELFCLYFNGKIHSKVTYEIRVIIIGRGIFVREIDKQRKKDICKEN